MPKLAAARRCVSADNLTVTFEGEGVDEGGMPLEAFLTALAGLRDAMRLMVTHLGGGEPGKPGKPPQWVRDQSSLRLVAIREGSLVTELAPQPVDDEAYEEHLGIRAMREMRAWRDNDRPALPEPVLNKLADMRSGLSAGTRIWLGDTARPRQAEIKPTRPETRPQRTKPEFVDAYLLGWLNEVNWAKKTAQLHEYHGREYVRLRFDEDLQDAMIHFATRYVKIYGIGRFNPDGKWDFVEVNEIVDPRSETFTVDEIKKNPNNPNIKIYDPDKAPTIDIDYEEVLEFIKENRRNRNLSRDRDLDG